jgi:hypothetical protein
VVKGALRDTGAFGYRLDAGGAKPMAEKQRLCHIEDAVAELLGLLT